jgi:uncharacterized protein
MWYYYSRLRVFNPRHFLKAKLASDKKPPTPSLQINRTRVDKMEQPEALSPTVERNILLQQHSRLAFLYAVPIGILGGLIGLGGAEFRLPVLAGPLKYPAHRAVPLNLAISLVTLATSLLIRGSTLSSTLIPPLLPAIGAMIMVTAFIGATLGSRLSKQQFERIILVLLLTIGTALIVEGFLPQQVEGLLPDLLLWWVIAGVLFGLAIGLVSR